MAITNTLKRQVDLPVFEWCRFAPAASTALSSSACANNSTYNANHGRYIYYLIAAASFWRYDTWSDTYQQLTSPPVTPVTWSDLEFSAAHGFESRVLGAGAKTVTCSAYVGQALAGYTATIVSGTGAGQKRIITSIAEPVAADSGVATAVVNSQTTTPSIQITDALKTWSINQWVGYQVRIVFGSGVSQVRRVIYNNATTLTLGDSSKMADDQFSNPGIFSPAISATAGSQSIYQIESSVVTVDTNWTTQPDTTSRFRVESGSLFLFSSAGSAPFYTVQQYDIVSDTWYIRTSCSNIQGFAGAEGSSQFTGEVSTTWLKSTASGAGTTTTLTDTSQTWAVNQWQGYWLYIYSGTGVNQLRQILSNTVNALTWTTAGTAPDATSQYVITGYTAGVVTTGGTTTLTDTAQSWTVNQWSNYAIKILSGTGAGQVQSIASNTATVLTFNKPLSTALDTTSQYIIIPDPDKIYVHLSANTSFFIHNIEDDLPTFSRNIDSGNARQGSVFRSASSAYGTFKPQAISTITFVTTTATVTTVNNHNFAVGQSVTISGETGNPTFYNGTFTIVSVPSTTTFTYTMSGTPSGNATFAGFSTTTLTDANKSWTTNQFAGYLVSFNTGSPTNSTGAATILTAVITSNTATTLTFTAATSAPINGVSRYVITLNKSIGVANATTDCGVATSGSTTTLVDTSKTWIVNIYAGRRVKFTGGAGQSQEGLIVSNTSNTLTFGAVTTAAAAGTTYSILQQSLRGVGAALQLAYNNTTPGNVTYTGYSANTSFPSTPNGRYMYIARGGGVVGFDRIDMTTDYLTLLTQTPQLETLFTGSNYAYDNNNRLYFSKMDATNSQQRLYYIDLNTYNVHGAGMIPYTYPTAINGNRMEVFNTVDGLVYLWIQRQSNQESFRALLFF